MDEKKILYSIVTAMWDLLKMFLTEKSLTDEQWKILIRKTSEVVESKKEELNTAQYKLLRRLVVLVIDYYKERGM